MSTTQKSVLLPFDKYRRLIAQRDALEQNRTFEDEKKLIDQQHLETPPQQELQKRFVPPGIPVRTRKRQQKKSQRKGFITR